MWFASDRKYCSNRGSGVGIGYFIHEERARLIDDVLADRIEAVLPNIMRREGMDMWIIISREYNEDPIIDYAPIDVVGGEAKNYIGYL